MFMRFLACVALVFVLLSGCAPYRVPVVQGNVITQEQAAALKPGMSRIQVRDILGTPLVSSLFHEGRWDYVFTLKQAKVEPQRRRLTVYFKGNVLDRIEADPLPSESEFAASLGRRARSRPPLLEAKPEELADFPAPERKSEPAPLPPLPASYPPLEPAV